MGVKIKRLYIFDVYNSPSKHLAAAVGY